MGLTVLIGRYCHSGPVSGDNSILAKLSVMPFCHGAACSILETPVSVSTTSDIDDR